MKNYLDARELPKAWPAAIRERTETIRGVRENPALLCLVEALTIQKCVNSDTGFKEKVALTYLRQHLGQAGVDRYVDSLTRVSQQARDLVEVSDAAWAVSPLTVGLTLAHDLNQINCPAPHVRAISNTIVDSFAGRGTLTSLVSLPARYGKSETAARRTIEMFLASYPGFPVMYITATESLAEVMGRKIRNDVAMHEKRFGFGLSPDSTSATYFNIATPFEGGEVFAAGLKTMLAGHGAALLVVDDIHKSDEGDSPQMQSEVWYLWQSVLQGRLQAGAPTIVIGTRYHTNDLHGRLLAGYDGIPPVRCKYILFPALATGDDELGRHKGDALPLGDVVPDGFGFTKEQLETKREHIAEEIWECSYQQNPIDLQVAGRAYSEFEVSKNVVDCSYDRSIPKIYLGIDLNVDSFSITFLQGYELVPTHYQMLSNQRMFRIAAFRELRLPEKGSGGITTSGAMEVAIEILCDLTDGEPTQIILCPDTAAGSRSTKGEAQVPRSDVEYIEDVFRKSPFKKTFRVSRFGSALRQRDRVNMTQGLLKSGSLIIDPSCRYLIRDLEKVRWLRDAAGNMLYRLDTRDSERVHQSDSMDYGLRVICGARYGPQGGSEPR